MATGSPIASGGNSNNASRSLIDINRGSHSRSNSRHRDSGGPSPFGSPTNGSPFLKSAMKGHSGPGSPEAIKGNVNVFGEELGGAVAALASDPKPPTASIYTRRVGFDTFESGGELEAVGSHSGGGTGINYSFTTSAKSAGFSRTKQTRTFLVGTDLNEYSKHALSFVLTQLAEDHDEIVVLRVISDPQAQSKPHELDSARDEAEALLSEIMRTNADELQISIVVEFAVGPIEETIHRMIEVYNPDSLIVGTRGLPDSVWKSAFMGSISRYCVARSPVPVVVVRPEDKVKKSLLKRRDDPSRRSYLSLVGGSGPASLDASKENLGLERTTTAPAPSSAAYRSDKDLSKEQRKKLEEDKKGKQFKKFGTFS